MIPQVYRAGAVPPPLPRTKWDEVEKTCSLPARFTSSVQQQGSNVGDNIVSCKGKKWCVSTPVLQERCTLCRGTQKCPVFLVRLDRRWLYSLLLSLAYFLFLLLACYYDYLACQMSCMNTPEFSPTWFIVMQKCVASIKSFTLQSALQNMLKRMLC